LISQDGHHAKARAATAQMGRRAAVAAEKYSEEAALARYRNVIFNARDMLLRQSR